MVQNLQKQKEEIFGSDFSSVNLAQVVLGSNQVMCPMMQVKQRTRKQCREQGQTSDNND